MSEHVRNVGGRQYPAVVSEGTKTILAAAAVALVAIIAGVWLARLGAWGLVAYVTVLAGAIVWLLASDALHRRNEDVDDRRPLGHETEHWLKSHGL
jgi:hypothetical protein